MSTKFFPLQIPPGVVATPTKKIRSSNWAEVNLVRWTQGQLAPVGGQSQYNFTFASRCKAIHSWYDLNGIFYTAYLCEQHLYVDDGGGVLKDISPTPPLEGPPDPGVGGYGDLLYGADFYGTPRDHSTILGLDKIPYAWSLDNFGQVLLAMTSLDGRLLQWQPGAPQATVVEAAPNGRGFVVTNERFVMIFGMVNDGTADGGSFRRFGWCDQENYNSWNFSDVTSQAGFLDIEPASPIVCAITTRNGVLLWTAKKTYLSQFLGLPYIYNFVELAANCTPWSTESVLTSSAMALWVSEQGLFAFDGTSVVPVPCSVWSWVLNDIDLINVREQACAGHISTFNEFWWFFPQNGQPYNTRVMIYNYKEGWCSQGKMSRSACISSSYSTQAIMADGRVAFQHELGNVYFNADLPWAETFDLNLTSGSRLITVKQLMPDIEGDAENLRYSLFYVPTMSRNAAVELQTPPQPVRLNGYVDFRTTGRDVRMRIAIAGAPVLPVTVGQHLIDGAPRGDR